MKEGNKASFGQVTSTPTHPGNGGFVAEKHGMSEDAAEYLGFGPVGDKLCLFGLYLQSKEVKAATDPFSLNN